MYELPKDVELHILENEAVLGKMQNDAHEQASAQSFSKVEIQQY